MTRAGWLALPREQVFSCFLLLQRGIMTTLWVSMAFHSGRLTLWFITTLLIMIDDGYPRMAAAGEQSWRHYYNSTGIDTTEPLLRCLDCQAYQQVTMTLAPIWTARRMSVS